MDVILQQQHDDDFFSFIFLQNTALEKLITNHILIALFNQTHTKLNHT